MLFFSGEKSEMGLKADIVFSTLKRIFDMAQNNTQLNEVFNCYAQNFVKKCVTSITFVSFYFYFKKKTQKYTFLSFFH